MKRYSTCFILNFIILCNTINIYKYAKFIDNSKQKNFIGIYNNIFENDKFKYIDIIIDYNQDKENITKQFLEKFNKIYSFDIYNNEDVFIILKANGMENEVVDDGGLIRQTISMICDYLISKSFFKKNEDGFFDINTVEDIKQETLQYCKILGYFFAISFAKIDKDIDIKINFSKETWDNILNNTQNNNEYVTNIIKGLKFFKKNIIDIIKNCEVSPQNIQDFFKYKYDFEIDDFEKYLTFIFKSNDEDNINVKYVDIQNDTSELYKNVKEIANIFLDCCRKNIKEKSKIKNFLTNVTGKDTMKDIKFYLDDDGLSNGFFFK
jgi:hypothetical protein